MDGLPSKVSYYGDFSGRRSAYIDSFNEDSRCLIGTEKHSDEPVELRWQNGRWEQV